jgi:hypothetical protein
VQVKVSRNNQKRKRNAQRSRSCSSIRTASEMKLPIEMSRTVGPYYANTASVLHVAGMDLNFFF